MGLNLGGMIFLQKRGFLSADKNRLLDIGPQNVYFTTEEQIDEFVSAQGLAIPADKYAEEKKRLAYFSTPRPEETTTLLSEITDLTNIDYHSFDVCPALTTELLDLNFDRLPNRHREYYDVILNFGTTEHIFNQWNSFEVMHDAAKVGGIIYHQLPASGYLDHGYYCYTPLFFKELAEANGYVVEELFITPAGVNYIEEMGLDVRGDEEKLSQAHSVKLSRSEERVPCFNIHVILRKTKSAQFRVALEIATAHAAPFDNVMGRYGEEPKASTGGSAQETEARIQAIIADREKRVAEVVLDRETKISTLVAEREEARSRYDSLEEQLSQIKASRSWRYGEILRKILGR